MSEPRHFKSEASRDRYLRQTMKEFKFMVDRYKKEPDPVKREEYITKARSYLHSHPSLEKALDIHFLTDVKP